MFETTYKNKDNKKDEARPIATFNYEPENKLTGKLVGWSFPNEFSDLRTGIQEMAKKNERFRTSVAN